jgi:hypothetical protein
MRQLFIGVNVLMGLHIARLSRVTDARQLFTVCQHSTSQHAHRHLFVR